MTERLRAAWRAFWDTTDSWLVVIEYQPIGWRPRQVFRTYESAVAWLEANRRPGDVVRVMATREWRRRTLALMASDEPWTALAALSHRLAVARGTIADTRSLGTAAVLNGAAAEQSRRLKIVRPEDEAHD